MKWPWSRSTETRSSIADPATAQLFGIATTATGDTITPETAESISACFASVQAIAETINPMVTPVGSREVAPLEIRWSSRPITERRTGMSRAGTATQFDFRLYEVDVEVRRNGTLVRDFTLRKAGWEAARPILPDED